MPTLSFNLVLAQIKIVVNGLASKTFLIHFYYYTQLA